MDRRNFLRKLPGLAAFGILAEGVTAIEALSGPGIIAKKIIIRGAWSNNILLDRIYMPSIFRVIQQNIPGADISFWPDLEDMIVMDKLRTIVTKMKVLSGSIGTQPNDSMGDINSELETADLLVCAGNILGGPDALNLRSHLSHSLPAFQYCRDKGVMYGLHSLKLLDRWNENQDLVKVINEASFAYTSFPIDKKLLSNSGITNKNVGFAPDAAYRYDLMEDSTASKYLGSIGLSGKEYLLLNIQKTGLDNGEKTVAEYGEYFRSLAGTWITNTGNAVLAISDNGEDLGFLHEVLGSSVPEKFKSKIVIREELSDPAEVLSVVDEARICIGNVPSLTMMAISSRVPVIFTCINRVDTPSRYIEPFIAANRLINLDTSAPSDLTAQMLDIQKNYVNALLEIESAMKNIVNQESSALKYVDQILKARSRKKSSSKKT
ncbi:MAG TPA: hypothetical protein VI583_07610 [Cyclobacteriaceae bacterium]|nr:hypothetical protein [Cyclobacteriaceae bacterium]